MEQLAALVLNGKGLKLIGKTSSSPEIQAFLDNVSAYMVLLMNFYGCQSSELIWIQNLE